MLTQFAKQKQEHTLLILVGGELRKGSKIVKSISEISGASVVPCYTAQHTEIERYIKKYLLEHGLTFEEELPSYIASLLYNNLLNVDNELHKLVLFSPKSKIYIKDAEKLYKQDSEIDFNKIGEYFCRRSYSTLSYVATHKNIIQILRAICYYMNKLIKVKLKIQSGQDIEKAISSLSPPLFFRDKNIFLKILSEMSIEKLISNLRGILSIEKKLKQGMLDDECAMQCIFRIMGSAQPDKSV